MFIGRTDAEAEALILWLHLMRRSDSLKKILMLGKIEDKRRKRQQRMRGFYSISDSIGFPGGSDGKASAYNAEDLGSILGSGRCPGEEDRNPLQYSCLENTMDRGAFWGAVHGVTESWMRLSN